VAPIMPSRWILAVATAALLGGARFQWDISAAQGRATPAPPQRAPAQPDLQGIWQVMNSAYVNILGHSASSDGPAGQGVVVGGSLPYQAWAAKKQEENFANRLKLDRERDCHLSGVPRATYLPFPFQIVQTPNMVVILYEWAHMTRRIYTDGTPHPEDLEFFNGDSRGRYERQTLVVDVANFNDKTWFDRAGNFHSDALKVEERYTRMDRDHIRYEATIQDPKVFTQSWKMEMILYRHAEPNAQILDYMCYAFEDRTPGLTVPLFRQSPLQQKPGP
jgi:hypothetical protein